MNERNIRISEFQKRSSLPIEEEEKRYVRKVLDAVRAQDWEQFRSLSYGGFENESSIRQDFMECSENLGSARELRVEFGAAEQADGSRVTVVEIASEEKSPSPIVLTLYKEAAKQAGFKIWTFHIRPAWLNFR